MTNLSNSITKGEAKFWLGIIALAVSGAVAFNTLSMRVEAMQEKGVKLRSEYEVSIIGLSRDVRIIKNNQIKIMTTMGIDPVK